MRSRGVGLALVTLAVLASSCASPLVGGLAGHEDPHDPSGAGAQASSCTQPGPGESFRSAEPDAVDVRAAAVEDAVAYATARGAQSVRVYRRDCLIGVSGWDPLTESSTLPAWSMTKGVVSLGVGRAVTMGLMEVDAPIGTYLPALSPAHAAITVRQLLNQTSGLRFAWANDLNLAGTGDSAARTLTRPFEAVPGTTFIYAQTTITALVSVVEAAVGEDFQSFIARELFEPIGITRNQWHWDRDPAGTTQGFAFLYMFPTAFGRIGSLLLDDGRWRGRELIAPSYMRQGATGSSANPGYGFLWRTNRTPPGATRASDDPFREVMASAPLDAFWFSGMFNQNVIMIPSLDIVVVRMGLPEELFADPLGNVASQRPDWDHRFFRMLLGGVTDVQVPDPGEWVPRPPSPPGLPGGLEPWHLIGIGY